jgi:hypothetical protein
MPKLPPGSIATTRPWQKNAALPAALRSPVPLQRKGSWVGKAVFRFRKDIVDQLGGSDALNPIQIQTIELACQLKARLLAMDKEFADAGASAERLSYTTTRSYLSLMHGMLRALRELGISGLALAKQKTGPSGLAERLSLLQGGKKTGTDGA